MVVYSHSRISTYENCPFQYKLKYIDKAVPLLGPSIESYMGKVVHEALEWLYDTAINHDLATKNEVIEYYETRWKTGWNNDIRVIKREFDAEHYKNIGKLCIEMYYERYKPFDKSIVMGLEKRIYVDLPEGKKMIGYIDRLDKKSANHFEIHDYKTSNRVMDQSTADIDRQLAIYALGIKQNFPEVEKVDLVWHFVKYDEEVVSIRNDLQLEELALETTEKINKIESAVDYPTSTSILCEWCDYKKQCPEFGQAIDGSDIKNTIDEFIRISDSPMPPEDKEFVLRTIGDKIRLFSQQTNKLVLEGTDKKILVENKFVRVPPDESDLRWYNLQNMLKNLGIETEDYNDLFENPKLSEEEKATLKQFFDIKKTIELRIE